LVAAGASACSRGGELLLRNGQQLGPVPPQAMATAIATWISNEGMTAIFDSPRFAATHVCERWRARNAVL
jgi:hypothetical protein